MNFLKETHKLIKKNLRVILIALILFILVLFYSKYFLLVLFIALAGLSKIYHRFFKSTIGVDLILFFTLITALLYNRILALFVAWLGLIIADTLGTKFTHFSLISLFSLTIIVIISKFLLFLPYMVALIVLTIMFEIITSVSYHFMGSPLDKIFVFLFSHLSWNLLLIFSFAEIIKKIII